jgi:hypothetical protein
MAYQQVTFGALRTDLKASMDSSSFWTNEEYRLAINEALRLYNLSTGLWHERVVTTTVADQVYYTVDSNLLHNTRVEFNEYTLTVENVDDMDASRPTWEGQTTATGGSVPTRPKVWIPVGIRTFALWPADHAGNNGLVIDGVADTPIFTEAVASDYINLGQEDHDAILTYAQHVLQFKGQRDRWRNNAPNALRTFFEAAARHNPKILNVPSVAQYFSS